MTLYFVIGNYTALPNSTTININVLPPKSIPGKLTITWDLDCVQHVYNDTLNQNLTLVNTSNCGTCTTVASSNFTTCNLTKSNLQVDKPVCNVTVTVQIIECNSVITEQYSADLNGELEIYNNNIIIIMSLFMYRDHGCNLCT